MWSNLRKMLAERLGRRPQRRAAQPHFRGQFEPLEQRTVLSATIGVMAFDAEANTVTIAVFQSYRPAPIWPAPVFFGNAPWEKLGSGGGVGNTGSLAYFAKDQDQHSTEVTISQDFESRLSGRRQGVDAAGKINATAESNTASTPVNSNAATGTFNYNFAPTFRPPRYVRAISGEVADFVPVLPGSVSSASTNLSNKSNVRASEVAFDAYSTDKLLLATADLRDDDVDRKLSDETNPSDETEETERGANDSFAAEQTAASLDALQRERTAIDAVLGELRDVKLKERDESSSTTADHEDQFRDTRTAAKEFLSAEEPTAHLRDGIPADGGMVLLQPTGDPNSSAYDLTDAFFSRLGGDDHAPLAVEASLGMYQAIDIGEQPAANRAQLPIAQPAQTVRPSVSAENAPAKKSEQPT
jgi:hypothetical protein